MVAFLRLEKLRRPDGLAAGALALAITLVALVAAPLLNKDTPWFDYETWALQTSSSKSTTFTWDHSYDGLNWPRDGRELLRVRAQRPAYWKAENLDTFDGERWLRSTVDYSVPEYPTDPERVDGAGRRRSGSRSATCARTCSSPPATRATWTSRGCSTSRRRTASTARRARCGAATRTPPRSTRRGRRRTSAERVGHRLRTVAVGLHDDLHDPARHPGRAARPDDVPVLRRTRSARSRSGRRTPSRPTRCWPRTGSPAPTRCRSNCSRAPRRRRTTSRPCSSYLGDESFTYTESPPPAARTLDGFLFDAKTGYCQQYSGAMALLLRMARHPGAGRHRVLDGRDGHQDRRVRGPRLRRPLVGRGLLPRAGAGSRSTPRPPPRRRAASPPTRRARAARAAARSRGSATRSSERGAGIPVAGEAKPWWYWPIRGLVVLAVAGLVLLAVRRWRRGAPPALTELERALRRTRRAPTPARRCTRWSSASPPPRRPRATCARCARAATRDAPIHPTRAQRRGLRSELGRGAGMLGHLRAWWALPPR